MTKLLPKVWWLPFLGHRHGLQQTTANWQLAANQQRYHPQYRASRLLELM